jgi:hypothetical protein
LNRFAASGNLKAEVDINTACETVRGNIKISAKVSLYCYELKKHKPWFNEWCSKLLDQRKQAKLQWLQDPSEINGGNLINIRYEANRHFKNKKREYMKDKINDLTTHSKNKNIRDMCRGINEFKKGYQPRSSLVKNEIGDLLADSHSILKNYFSNLLHLHRFSDFGQ